MSNANGTPSPALVVGEGSLSLSNFINLDFVLVVPSLDHNLSVAQLNTTLGCNVKSWPNYCVFQDILTGNMIGCGTKRANSTTWAPNSETKVGQAFTTSRASFERQRNKVWL
ncbi:unnamed protein product [Prunus armeniaca]